ncbi:hypothetical protein F5Y04DRAFT_180422 [Hypomontagnella monticulosa]|nr:hypothetical protein F5Y04DRAFT_180422 [Hypomontagnella monticulosa]
MILYCLTLFCFPRRLSACIRSMIVTNSTGRIFCNETSVCHFWTKKKRTRSRKAGMRMPCRAPFFLCLDQDQTENKTMPENYYAT